MSWLTETASVAHWVIAVLVVVAVTGWIYVSQSQRRDSMDVAVEDAPPLDDALHALAGIGGGPVLDGNAVEAFQDGAFFDALARDFEAARHSIHLETFIWGDGALTRRFSDIFLERTRAGVCVRLAIDAMGSRQAKRKNLKELRDAGVSVAHFRPLGRRALHAQNYRDHRKIAVIDGRIGYVMGHGFEDTWMGAGQDGEHWRDTGLRIEGPAVHQLQSAFATSWIEAGRKVIVEPEAWPELQARGPARVHVSTSSSGDVSSAVELLYQLAMDSSRRELLIANPYFAPEEDFVEILARSSRRGVETTLLVPGPITDSHVIRHAGHACFEKLLRDGVRIFEHAVTFPHQKVMIVDGTWSCVGSTNMDLHSLEMSEEVSVGVHDVTLALDLRRAFMDDLAHSKEITAEDWLKRGLFHRIADRLAYSLKPQL